MTLPPTPILILTLTFTVDLTLNLTFDLTLPLTLPLTLSFLLPPYPTVTVTSIFTLDFTLTLDLSLALTLILDPLNLSLTVHLTLDLDPTLSLSFLVTFGFYPFLCPISRTLSFTRYKYKRILFRNDVVSPVKHLDKCYFCQVTTRGSS